MLREAVARALAYHFLAQCYRYPSPEFRRGLRQPELWQQLHTAGKSLGPSVHRAILRLQGGTDRGLEELRLLDLEIEYTFLFVNAVPRLPAPPYESAYSSEGLLMGPPVSQVLCAYRDAGLVPCKDGGLLPDHLSTELAFMAYLVEQEAAQLQGAPTQAKAWQARQRCFLEEHLLCWGPAFLARVEDHARRPFYRHIADLTSALLRFEEQRLGLPASVARRNT